MNVVVVIIYLVMATGLTKGKLLAVIGDEVCVQFVLYCVLMQVFPIYKNAEVNIITSEVSFHKVP